MKKDLRYCELDLTYLVFNELPKNASGDIGIAHRYLVAEYIFQAFSVAMAVEFNVDTATHMHIHKLAIATIRRECRRCENSGTKAVLIYAHYARKYGFGKTVSLRELFSRPVDERISRYYNMADTDIL
jgi:hypothetical protein